MLGCAHADYHHWQPRSRVMVPLAVSVNVPQPEAGSAWPHAQANWHGPHPGYYSGQTGPALTNSLSMLPAHHQADSDPWRSYWSHLAGVAAQAQPPGCPQAGAAPVSLGHDHVIGGTYGRLGSPSSRGLNFKRTVTVVLSICCDCFRTWTSPEAITTY